LIKKLAAVEISSSIVGNALSAAGHGSALEEFAYLNKQKGPHGAAPGLHRPHDPALGSDDRR